SARSSPGNVCSPPQRTQTGSSLSGVVPSGEKAEWSHNVSVVPALTPLLAEHPPLARVAAWPAYRWLVVGTVCLGAFMGQLDASIAGLVLPTLQEVFAAPIASVEWVAIAYLLTLAALVVPLGRLADLLGRKMLY